MNRTRRSILATVAAVAGAGCIGSTADPGTPSDTTTSERPTTTTTASETADVTVSEVTVSPGVVIRTSPDSIGVSGAGDEQFVVATVAADGTPAPDRSAFALETAGKAFGPAEGVGGLGGRLWRRGDPYEDGSAGWIAFVVPKPLDVEQASLTWPGGTYVLNDTALTRLARPPTSFEVRTFSAPDSVRVGEDAALEVTVENVGTADGTWIGALNRSGPSVAYFPEATISLNVPAGETGTWTYTNAPDDRHGDGTGTMTFRLGSRGDSRSRSVEVTADSTQNDAAMDG